MCLGHIAMARQSALIVALNSEIGLEQWGARRMNCKGANAAFRVSNGSVEARVV